MSVEDEIEVLWQRMRHLAGDRVAVLEQAAQQRREGRLGPELQAQARHAAHKLAGALGSYGRPTGSAAADAAERALRADPVDLRGLEAALRALRDAVDGTVQ